MDLVVVGRGERDALLSRSTQDAQTYVIVIVYSGSARASLPVAAVFGDSSGPGLEMLVETDGASASIVPLPDSSSRVESVAGPSSAALDGLARFISKASLSSSWWSLSNTSASEF